MKGILLALPLSLASVSAFAGSQLSLASGFDYSSGKYGNATSTQILYVPVIGQYVNDALTLKLTIPFLSVTGPGGVIQGYGRVVPTSGSGGPRAGRTGGQATYTGLGDAVAAADYAFYSVGPISLDAVGKIKFATGSADQGLGTGQNDYSAQLDGYYSLVDNATLFATAGYKIVGAPAGVSVNNVGFGTLGAEFKLSEVTNVGMMLDYVQKISTAGGDREEATAYIMLKLSRTLRLQANVLKGFTDGSPDYGFGAVVKGYF